MDLNPTYQDGLGLFQKSFPSNIYISSIYVYYHYLCYLEIV